jgi:cephalosporin-C deacetylase-like acetyl esterase
MTLQEQIAEAQRELARRRQCYPGWITSGTLDAGDAQYQIRCMEEIVRTLMRLDAEQRQLSLFGTGEGGG